MRNVGAAIWPPSVAAAASVEPQLSQLKAWRLPPPPHRMPRRRIGFTDSQHFQLAMMITETPIWRYRSPPIACLPPCIPIMVSKGVSLLCQLWKSYHKLHVTELGGGIQLTPPLFARLSLNSVTPCACAQHLRGQEVQEGGGGTGDIYQRGHLAAHVTIKRWEVGRLAICSSIIGRPEQGNWF
jgi:hypothetical protein